MGYSVTYALHIAHNYNQMREDDQDLRAAEAKARQRQKERSKAKLAAKAARERARDPDFEELGVEARCFLACRSLPFFHPDLAGWDRARNPKPRGLESLLGIRVDQLLSRRHVQCIP